MPGNKSRRKRIIHVHRFPACKQRILRNFPSPCSRWQIGKRARCGISSLPRKFITKKDGDMQPTTDRENLPDS